MCCWPGAAKVQQEWIDWMVSILRPMGAMDPMKFRQALAHLGFVRDDDAAKAFLDEVGR
jgi:hypothetical protein